MELEAAMEVEVKAVEEGATVKMEAGLQVDAVEAEAAMGFNTAWRWRQRWMWRLAGGGGSSGVGSGGRGGSGYGGGCLEVEAAVEVVAA